MSKGLSLIVALAFFMTLLFASGALYTVDETQQVVITQFGKLIGDPIKEPGLKWKMPFVQVANYFDKRVLVWDGDPNEIPTLEKRNISVDTTARWKIVDPLKFMRTVRTESGAQTRLDDIIDAKTREVISAHALVEAVRNTNRLLEEDADVEMDDSEIGKIALKSIQMGREGLNREVLNRSSNAVSDFGIDLVDVRIKRITYVQSVQNKVYERMISERKRAAEQYRSEGQGKRAEIEGQTRKELEAIRAEAYRQAQGIRGNADAKATNIYADAYNNDPDFYAFMKSLESYKKAIKKDTTFVLSTDNEFYRYVEGIYPELQP